MKPKKHKIQDETNSVPNIEIGCNSHLNVGKNMFYGALPIHFELAKKLRNNFTDAESYLWENIIRIKTKGIRFKRQHPVLYFIADFYCHQAKLIIEIDGGYHNEPEQFKYDQNRDSELAELGLKVIRFSNEQVFNDIENVLRHIEIELYARI